MATREKLWLHRLDRWALWAAALVPVGIAMGTTVFEALVVGVDLCWLAGLTLKGRISFEGKERQTFWALAGWLAAIWLSRIASPFADLHTWGHDLAFIRYLVFILALMEMAVRLPVATYLAWGLAAGVAWSAVNTILAFTIGFDLVGHPAWRYSGKLKEAGRIGGLAAYAGPFLFFWALTIWRSKKRQALWLVILSLAACGLLINSANRTALAAVAVGMTFGCLYLLRHHRRKLIIFMVLCVFLSAAGPAILNLRRINLGSFYDRIYYWKVSLAVWQENPLIGVGIGSFKEAYHSKAVSGQVKPFVAPDGTVWAEPEAHHAHNLLLQLLVCTGLVGLTAFGHLFYRLCRFIPAAYWPWRTGLATWPVIFLVIGLAGWNIFDAFYAAVFAFMAALTITGCRQQTSVSKAA